MLDRVTHELGPFFSQLGLVLHSRDPSLSFEWRAAFSAV